jgi:hypothetical protein
MTDYELDTFFKELQMEQDIANFIHHSKTPKYLKKMTPYQYSRMKNHYPELNPIGVYDSCEYTYGKDDNDVSIKLHTSICKCDEIIKVITMPTYEPDTCPICICEFEETNYVIPKCGHKVCAVCFTKNVKHNKATGDCCVLCRKKIC